MIKFTDLDNSVLVKGKPWPPVSEVDRLTRYTQNESLFDGEHTKVFLHLLNLFSSHTAEYNKLVIIFNFHKRLSTLWSDFLYGEQPTATVAEDPESAEQKCVDDFILRNKYWLLQHARQLDVSRFGHGIIEAYYEGGCRLQLIHPSKYFQLVDSAGRTTGHMVAWPDEPATVEHVRQSTLFVRIHTAGQIESREYTVSSSGYIIAGPRNTKIEPTGVDKPLVSVIDNLLTSSGKLVDDYGDLDSIIKRIEARLTRVGRILDVHSEPLLMLPEDSGAFTKTETGAVIYDSKRKVLEMPKGGQGAEYITWEGQLAAAFNEIQDEMNKLYVVSETCEACFEPTKLGAQVSGTALRLMLFIPLKKVDRLKLIHDPTVTDEIKLFTDFENVKGYSKAVPIESVSINWQDGLPEDFNETVQQVVALKAQGLIWDEQALKMLFKLKGKALQEAVTKLQASKPPAFEEPAPLQLDDMPDQSMMK